MLSDPSAPRIASHTSKLDTFFSASRDERSTSLACARAAPSVREADDSSDSTPRISASAACGGQGHTSRRVLACAAQMHWECE